MRAAVILPDGDDLVCIKNSFLEELSTFWVSLRISHLLLPSSISLVFKVLGVFCQFVLRMTCSLQEVMDPTFIFISFALPLFLSVSLWCLVNPHYCIFNSYSLSYLKEPIVLYIIEKSMHSLILLLVYIVLPLHFIPFVLLLCYMFNFSSHPAFNDVAQCFISLKHHREPNETITTNKDL